MKNKITKPVSDDILPEPTRTEPLKLIEPELPKEATHFEMYDGEEYVKENVSVIEDFMDKYL